MFDKTMTLAWKGSNYTIPVTMRLVEKVDSEFNIMRMIVDMSKEIVRISESAKLVSIVLNEGGADVTPEDVYVGMGGSSTNLLGVIDIQSYIISHLYPQQEAEEEPKKKPRKRKN